MTYKVACVAGVRKGKGEGKSKSGARARRAIFPSPFPFLAPATQATYNEIISAKYILLSTVTCVSFNHIKRTVSCLHVNECTKQ